MPTPRHLLISAAIAVLFAGCGRPEPSVPVRTAADASEIAQRTLKTAGLDEEVVDCRREDGGWVVVTRWRETSMAGHLVTVEAATGKTRVERYRSIELGRPR